LKYRLPGGCGGVDAVLVKVKVDLEGMEFDAVSQRLAPDTGAIMPLILEMGRRAAFFFSALCIGIGASDLVIKHFSLHSWHKTELWEISFGITAGLLLLEFFIRTPPLFATTPSQNKRKRPP
jgi:hypothetical protein